MFLYSINRRSLYLFLQRLIILFFPTGCYQEQRKQTRPVSKRPPVIRTGRILKRKAWISERYHTLSEINRKIPDLLRNLVKAIPVQTRDKKKAAPTLRTQTANNKGTHPMDAWDAAGLTLYKRTAIPIINRGVSHNPQVLQARPRHDLYTEKAHVLLGRQSGGAQTNQGGKR